MCVYEHIFFGKKRRGFFTSHRNISLLTKSCLRLFENHRITPHRHTEECVGWRWLKWIEARCQAAHESVRRACRRVFRILTSFFAIYKQLYGGEECVVEEKRLMPMIIEPCAVWKEEKSRALCRRKSVDGKKFHTRERRERNDIARVKSLRHLQIFCVSYITRKISVKIFSLISEIHFERTRMSYRLATRWK